MSLKLALFSLIAVLPPGAVSQARQPADVSGTLTATGPRLQDPQFKGRTPADRLLVPYLNARFAASPGGKPMGPAAARPASVSTAARPNFGGYLTAPFYPGRLEPSCVLDQNNCGVAIELTADFNMDGKPDVAVIQNDGILNILLNDGNGGFAAAVSYLNPNYSSSFIQQGFAVDVNNDGYADIVAVDGGNNAVIVFLNRKDGSFGAAQDVALSSAYGSINSIAIGDVDGDGKLDLVTIAANVISRTNTAVTVQTYLGTGHGSFKAPGSALTQTVNIAAQVQIPTSLGITLGDLNRDGKLDLAADLEEQTSQTAGNVVATIALGKGDGSFGSINVTNPISVPVSSNGLPFLIFGTSGVQIADLKNDERNDLAIDAGGALFVALGDGKGGFSTQVQTAGVAGSSQILYADVTGDGIPDLIQDNGLLNIWIGKGDGTFKLPINGNTYIVDSGGGESLAVADFTGNGNADIAQLGGDYKQVSLFVGNGKGAFQGAPALSSTTESASRPFGLILEAAGDFVGNGYTDLLFVDINRAAPYVVSGISNKKGGFTYATALSSKAVPALDYIQPVTADFNGDGKQDLLIVGGKRGNTLAVSLSKGDGTFQSPVALALPSLDCTLNYAAAGDLNGDGNLDIVVTYPGDSACGGKGSEPSGYFVALGKGNGTFAKPEFTASGSELYAATLADMNMDGNPDLILIDDPFDGSGNFAVNLLPGNGDGTFSPGTAVLSDSVVSQAIAVDYNQDGKPDLILFSEGTQSVASTGDVETAGVVLLPGNGDGTFGDSNQIATGNFFLNGLLADVNNDGIPDLVAALYHTTGQPKTYYGLSTLLGTGDGGFAEPVNSLESLSSDLPVAGHFLAGNAPAIAVSTAYGTALFLGQGGSNLSLSSSSASIAFGQTATFTAKLTPILSGRPSPTGLVAFYDGSTLLGSSSISNSSATYSASALAVGTHSVTAVYNGDGNFNPNTSSAATVAVTTLAPAFTLTAAPDALNVNIGQQAVSTLTLTANATFSGSIDLACSGLPANASCTVNPAQITLAGGTSSQASIVVGTTASAANDKPQPYPLSKLAGGLTLAGLFCLFVRRRSARGIFPMLVLLSLTVALAALSGCGSGGLKTVHKGTYTVTITAKPSGSAASSQTATVSVNVQ